MIGDDLETDVFAAKQVGIKVSRNLEEFSLFDRKLHTKIGEKILKNIKIKKQKN